MKRALLRITVFSFLGFLALFALALNSGGFFVFFLIVLLMAISLL